MHSDVANQFRDAIARAGLAPPERIETDGELHRFVSSGKRGDDAGYYVLHVDGIAAGAFGDWRTDFYQTWRADTGRRLSSSETAQYNAVIANAKRKRDAEREQRHNGAREVAERDWGNARPAAELGHGYLSRKGVQPCGTRVLGSKQLVPMYDVDGTLHSLQRIDANGGKQYLPGGRVRGCFYTIGERRAAHPIYVCEGFATGASIHQATGGAVVVAFDAGNLEAVTRELRGRYPRAELVLCADDDYMTAGNTGVTKAQAAAKAVGARVVVPLFGEQRPDGATDFNDLHLAKGIDAVRNCIEQPDYLEYAFADRLNDADDLPDELVERVLERAALSVIYGDSNSGKTFFAIDLACSVAGDASCRPWMGRMVQAGLVVYLATEAPASVRRRSRVPATSWAQCQQPGHRPIPGESLGKRR